MLRVLIWLNCMLNRLHAYWEVACTSARKNPVATSILVTSSLCMYFEVRAARFNYNLLHATQASVDKMVDEVTGELRDALKSSDAKFGDAMKARDDFTRQLQLQNIEQQKSVSRLNAALRMCVQNPRALLQGDMHSKYYGGNASLPLLPPQPTEDDTSDV